MDDVSTSPLKSFDVTFSVTGGLTVQAHSAEEAERLVGSPEYSERVWKELMNNEVFIGEVREVEERG